MTRKTIRRIYKSAVTESRQTEYRTAQHCHASFCDSVTAYKWPYFRLC